MLSSSSHNISQIFFKNSLSLPQENFAMKLIYCYRIPCLSFLYTYFKSHKNTTKYYIFMNFEPISSSGHNLPVCKKQIKLTHRPKVKLYIFQFIKNKMH